VTVNRRSATRHDVAIAVTVVVQGESNEPVEATIENLSLGGACVRFNRLSIGTRLTLRFRLPIREQPIEAGAVVRWCTDNGVGVQFDGLRAGEVWSLGKYFEGMDRP
jgi:hypothetical protein